MKNLSVLALLLFSIGLQAQEICNNGIDDDGDQLIDLQDEECDCTASQLSMIEADFEAFNCCPTTITHPVNGIDGYFCLNTGVEWEIGNDATTDYYNTCGFLGDESVAPLVPQPIPSGNGAIGMFSETDGSFSEGISKCLDCKLVPGESYDVTFFAGFNSFPGIKFNPDCCASTSPVEFALLGRLDCENQPAPSYLPLRPTTGWVELATFTAVGEPGEWVEVSGSFVAQDEYMALAFFKSLAFIDQAPATQYSEYHYMDALQITGRVAGEGCGIIQSPPTFADLSGDCVNGYILEGSAAGAVQFQWYIDSVALVGATDSQLIGPTQNGTYQVMATFPDGTCSVSEPIEVDLAASAISIVDTLTFPSCPGDSVGSIELSVTGSNSPFSIVWDNGGMGPVISDLPLGNYTATITDAIGCERVSVIELPEAFAPVIFSETNDPECPGELGRILGSIFAGAPPFTYSWNNGATGNIINVPAGTYSYTVTDGNGCTSSEEVDIFEPPTIEISVVSLVTPDVGAANGSVSVSAAGGTGPFIYSWSNGTNGPLLLNVGAGTYQVTATDANDCTSILSFTLTESDILSASTNLTQNICFGDCIATVELLIAGGEAPFDVLWSNGQTGLTASELCDGNYSVMITDAAGQELILSNLVISSLPDLILEAAIENISCAGANDGQIEVLPQGGVAPYYFSWGTGDNTAIVQQLAPQAYGVTVQDAVGCVIEESYVVEDYQPLDIDFTTTYADCGFDEFVLNLVPPFDATLGYLLNGEPVDLALTGTLEGLPPGNYTLSYREASGCEVVVGEFDLLNEPPYELFVNQSTQNLAFGETVELELQVIPEEQFLLDNEIVWTLNNPFECITVFNDECIGLLVGTTFSEVVEVSFTDQLGCEQRIFIPLEVEAPENYVYIPNVFSPNRDGVNDVFTIFTTSFVQEVAEVQVFDRWGGQVYVETNLPSGTVPLWDGFAGGKESGQGVYAYFVTLILASGEEVVLSGDLTLLR
ncbi:MAG: gliding motility-associated C-terminal domain-containing protein [Bacteroidota bacterium]